MLSGFSKEQEGKERPAQLPPKSCLPIMPKIELAAQGGDRDPRTAHLRPVIEYLLAQGNTPAGWRGDAFTFDQGG